MNNSYSKIALLEFLDYLATKGLVKRPTAASRKAACNNVLSVLDNSESEDLRRIDLDDVSSRFANLQGSRYTPASLRVYKSRVSKALKDFFRYKENPANFGVASRSKPLVRKTGAVPAPVVFEPSYGGGASTERGLPISTLNIPIHLRPGIVVQLNGLPVDLTTIEAQKIANVVVANVVINSATEDEL